LNNRGTLPQRVSVVSSTSVLVIASAIALQVGRAAVLKHSYYACFVSYRPCRIVLMGTAIWISSSREQKHPAPLPLPKLFLTCCYVIGVPVVVTCVVCGCGVYGVPWRGDIDTNGTYSTGTNPRASVCIVCEHTLLLQIQGAQRCTFCFTSILQSDIENREYGRKDLLC
jgi:hypothetical protein